LIPYFSLELGLEHKSNNLTAWSFLLYAVLTNTRHSYYSYDCVVCME